MKGGHKMNRRIEYLMLLVMALAMGPNAGVGYATEVYDRALVAHYEFEGHGNDSPGVLQGDARIVCDADRGNVLKLADEGDHLDCDDDPIFNFNKAITIACWIKYTTYSDGIQTAVSRQGRNWMLGREGRRLILYCNDTRPTERIYGSSDVPNGKWHHIAGVYDGSQMYLYLDGRVDASTRTSGEIELNGGDVWLGPDPERVASHTWRGSIDDVAIFSRPLSPDEIEQLRSEGLSPFMAGPRLKELVERVNKDEKAAREQDSEQAVAFLEREIAEHDKWKRENQNDVVFHYKRISSDLYFLLARAKEQAGRAKEEIAQAYRQGAMESDRFSALSVPRQGCSLLWLHENGEREDYEVIACSLIQSNSDHLASVARKAEIMVSQGQAEAAIKFLTANLGVYERWREQHPYDEVVADDYLPTAYFQLAKAKQAVGAGADEVADTYCKTFSSSDLHHVPERIAALTWLIENDHSGKYKEALRSFTQNREAGEHFTDVVSGACDYFASKNDWPGLERLADSLLTDAEYPAEWSLFVESCLSNKSKQWAKKYTDSINSKPRLRFGRDCFVADEYLLDENFGKASELYRDILGRCSPKDDKGLFEFRLGKSLFEAGQYREAGPVLESFIADRKETHSDLVKEALLIKGQVHIQLGELDEAGESFFKLMMGYHDTGDMAEVNFFLGYCYLMQGKYEAASEAFDCLVKHYPDSSHAEKAGIYVERIKIMTK
jgi:tetratricopeptide (TPR) repeat protein